MRYLLTSVALALLTACSSTKQVSNTTPNALSDKERNQGWTLLFDGQTTAGWHTYNKPGSIGKAWKVENGTLHLDAAAKKEWQSEGGGDIATDEEFENFHLSLEWKIAPNGNSGVMFYVHEDPSIAQPWYTGPEMQVLDNAGHPDAKIVTHRAGDLYDLMTAKEAVKPAGEWNHAEIKANQGKLQFYLNGKEILSTTMWDDNWRAMIAKSKFKDMPGFGTYRKGKIALQDHGNDVWYRNIKIRRL